MQKPFFLVAPQLPMQIEFFFHKKEEPAAYFYECDSCESSINATCLF